MEPRRAVLCPIVTLLAKLCNACAPHVSWPPQVPLELAVRETSDAGAPIVASQPESASAKVYRSIAERVEQKLAQTGPAAGPKIVME